jgi:putative membrane protein
MLKSAGALFLLALASQADAHTAAADVQASPDWLAAFLLGVWLWYVLGCWRMHQEQVLRRILGTCGPLAFAGGMAILLIALASPLDILAAQLFSVHMTQHMLLLVIAPPLLVWGRPALAWQWVFAPRGRRILARWWHRARGWRRSLENLQHPWPGWTVASLTLWIWHIPALYALALRSPALHAFEHVCFLLSACAFWSPIMQVKPAHRAHAATLLLTIATFALHSGLLGALITFSQALLYHPPFHSSGTLTPLEDQQLAGLIMWIPAGFVYLAAFALVFVRWMQPAQPARRRARAQAWPRAA